MIRWIEDLKCGDTVIVEHGHHLRRNVTTVTKVTKTQIRTNVGSFHKLSGELVGSGAWGRTHLVEGTEKRISKALKRNHKRDLLFF